MKSNQLSNMKILFVSTNDWVPWGGSEDLWYKTAILLKKKGLNIHISVKEWNGTPKHILELKKVGCTVHFRNNTGVSGFFKKIIKRIFSQKKLEISLIEIISPDLVVINQGSLNGGMDWGRACQAAKIPYTFIVQLVHELNVWEDSIVQEINSVFTSARVVYFVSKQNKKIYESITGYKLTNSSVIRNPFKEITLIDYPDVNETFNIAFVASLNSFHKGHDMLFEILRKEKWKLRKLSINLYGKGINEKTLKRLKETYSLENINFMGFELDIEEIYRLNHAFILCSRMEGQSLALIEAMYCGRVPIVTNVGGAEELITNGIDGFIAKSPNIIEIEENLDLAWSKRKDWKKMGEKARENLCKIIKCNPIEAFAEEIIKLI